MSPSNIKVKEIQECIETLKSYIENIELIQKVGPHYKAIIKLHNMKNSLEIMVEKQSFVKELCTEAQDELIIKKILNHLFRIIYAYEYRQYYFPKPIRNIITHEIWLHIRKEIDHLYNKAQ
jgi:hypothetical protein